MPSIPSSPPSAGNAEVAFRSAFERLVRGKPDRMPKNTPVTQNNIAKEAGRDPSALKKTRYPELIREIQHWVEQHSNAREPSARQAELSARNRSRSLKKRIDVLKSERDIALSLLVEADAKILDLATENERLKAALEPSKIIDMRRRQGEE